MAMRKWDVWHVVWVLVLVVGGVLLGVTLAVAVAQRGNAGFVNVASIWGLFVGLIGFLVTIYTLFETQRVTRDAQRETRAATEKARQETKEAIQRSQEQTQLMFARVRAGLREVNFWTLSSWVKTLRAAVAQKDWPRALFLSEESSAVGERLAHSEGLTAQEQAALLDRLDDVRALHVLIRTQRTADGSDPALPLDAKDLDPLDQLVHLLDSIGGRLHHEPTKDLLP